MLNLGHNWRNIMSFIHTSSWKSLLVIALLLIHNQPSLSQSSIGGLDFRQFRARPPPQQQRQQRLGEQFVRRIRPGLQPRADKLQRRIGDPQLELEGGKLQPRVIHDWESYKVKRIRNKAAAAKPTRTAILPPIRRNEEPSSYFPVFQSEAEDELPDESVFIPTALPPQTTQRPTWTTKRRVTSVYFPTHVNVATTPIPPWAQTHPAPTKTTTTPR